MQYIINFEVLYISYNGLDAIYYLDNYFELR